MAVTSGVIAVALGQAAPETGSPNDLQWSMWIADALMLIEARRLKVDDTLVLDPATVDYVVRQAVVARAERPKGGATQESVTVDDATRSSTYARSRRVDVEILDEWWALLGLTTTSGSGAFSFRPYGSGLGYGAHQPWCSLAFGALYCSCGADLTADTYPLYEF